MRTIAISDLSFCERYSASEVQGGLSVYVPRVKAKVDTATANAIEVALVVTPLGAVGGYAAAAAGAGAGAASVGGSPTVSVQATASVGLA